MRGDEYEPGSRNYHDDEWNGKISYPARHKIYGIPTKYLDEGFLPYQNLEPILWSEVQELSKNQLISFQSHGVTHSAVSSLNEEEIELEGLSELFTNNFYIMFFWIHFIAINLFTGGWMVKDSQKFSINKILLSVPLIVTYLIGPLGLFVYWLIKIFHAKSINLHD